MAVHMVYVRYGQVLVPLELSLDATVGDLREAAIVAIKEQLPPESAVVVGGVFFAGSRLAEACLLSDEGVGMEATVELMPPGIRPLSELHPEERSQAQELLSEVFNPPRFIQLVEGGAFTAFCIGEDDEDFIPPMFRREELPEPGTTLLHRMLIKNPPGGELLVDQLQVLLTHDPALLDVQTDRSGESALIRACAVSTSAFIAELLKRNADTALRNAYGSTALHYAVGRQDLWSELGDLAHRLISPTALVAKTSSGQTPLFYAARVSCSNEWVEALLAAGASATETDKLGFTCLHYAGTVDTINSLVKAGCDVDPVGNDGRSPLHLFALRGASAQVSELLRLGADGLRRTREGKTPYMVAAAWPTTKALLPRTDGDEGDEGKRKCTIS
eukprot:Hpha_TRINITY_DN22861_c0_g1::TRINITY_DN22861_c0_g1_i1::g.84392::m.84392